MKNIQIIILAFLVAAIATLVSFMGNLTTYDTVASARKKAGQFVHLVARLDRTRPVEYDAVKNPNYLSFRAVDSLGAVVKVVYRNAKPENLEVSERLVLKGAIQNDHFECKEILMKCPSKYKDDRKQSEKNLPNVTATAHPKTFTGK